MKVVCSGLAVLGAIVACFAEVRSDQPNEQVSDSGQRMELWKERMKPGAEEAGLAKLAGTWDCKSRLYLGGQQTPPVEATGVSIFRPVLGGRFIQHEYTGRLFGSEVTGLGLLGFDHGRKQYVSTWADSVSSNIGLMTGWMSSDGKKLTSFGTIDEYWSGEIGKTIKQTVEFVDNDTCVFTSWQVAHGEDSKAFEIEYRRRK